MLIRSISIYKYSIPMVPFTIATGTMTFAQNILIHLHTADGLKGVGECSAFPMIAGETQETCYVLAKDFAQLWKGKDASQIAERLADLHAFVAGNYTIKSAFDMALYDLAAKAANQPLYAYLGGHYALPETDLTIGIGSVNTMVETAMDFVNNRAVKMIKIKLGKQVAEDVARVAAIRKAIGPAIILRIDANQGWTFAQAVEALQAMEPYHIQFCEQPMPKYLDDKLPALKATTIIPIMADESVFTHHDALRLINTNGVDFINIKLSKAGGIAEALRIHAICKLHGIPNMLGGMLESRVALSANVHLALACPNIIFYDLDTCLLGHLQDPVMGGVMFEGMKLKLPNQPGIGADVDAAFLQTCPTAEV